eukprot:g71.t1
MGNKSSRKSSKNGSSSGDAAGGSEEGEHHERMLSHTANAVSGDARSKFKLHVPHTILQRATSVAKEGEEDDDSKSIHDRLVFSALKALPQLKSFKKAQLQAIASQMTRLEYEEGEIVVEKGGEIDSLFIVETGVLEYGGETYGKGKGLGAEALLSHSVAAQQSATVKKGEGKLVAWAINRMLFQAILIKTARERDTKRDKILRSVPILAPLSKEQRTRVARKLKRVKFKAGATMIRQGEVGNTIYFIEKGEVVVMQKTRGEADAREVNRHGPGGFVGEGAIVNEGADGGLRNADCVAATNVVCHSLSRKDFQNLLGPLQELIRLNSIARVLKSVKILEGMTQEEREEVASILEVRSYSRGEKIIAQGDRGDEMFFIEAGEVEFTRVEVEGSAPESIGRFFANQFFGEGSLLTDAPRRATATAASETVVCFALSGTAFRSMFTDAVAKQARRAYIVRSESSGSIVSAGESTEKGKVDVKIKASELNGIRILGKGSYGLVTLVRHEVTGMAYALKQLTKKHIIEKEQEEHVVNERVLLGSVHHPFVCNLVTTFKNKHSLYMLMEPVMGGELYTHIKQAGRGRGLSEEETRFYGAQVVSIFEHLHAKRIIFRDLKPENLLVARDGYLKMVDFGLAKMLPRDESKTYTLCGTPAYASPEVYACLGHDKGVDWWCTGVLIHELHAGYPPFAGHSPAEISEEISRYSHAYPNVAFPAKFSESTSELLCGLLHPDAAQRLGNTRLGARAVKDSKFFESVDFAKLLAKGIQPVFVPEVEDAYDSSNFANKRGGFETELMDDEEGTVHEEWCEGF